jgi:hypothetical protein
LSRYRSGRFSLQERATFKTGHLHRLVPEKNPSNPRPALMRAPKPDLGLDIVRSYHPRHVFNRTKIPSAMGPFEMHYVELLAAKQLREFSAESPGVMLVS